MPFFPHFIPKNILQTYIFFEKSLELGPKISSCYLFMNVENRGSDIDAKNLENIKK